MVVHHKTFRIESTLPRFRINIFRYPFGVARLRGVQNQTTCMKHFQKSARVRLQPPPIPANQRSLESRAVLMSLLEVSFKDLAWLHAYGLTPHNALEYFSLSQFYDRTCNNEVVKMQTKFNNFEEMNMRMGYAKFSSTYSTLSA